MPRPNGHVYMGFGGIPSLTLGLAFKMCSQSRCPFGLLLLLKEQMEAVAKRVFAQISLVCQLHYYLDREAVNTIAHILVILLSDYCNVLYMGLPLKINQKLELVHNSVVHAIMRGLYYMHVTHCFTSCTEYQLASVCNSSASYHH